MSGVTTPRIAFVTEGGPDVGLGHLSRCAALGRAAVADGGQSSFLVPDPAQLSSHLRGVEAEILRSSWMADPVRARETLARLSPDVIVVDSYAASPEFLFRLREIARVVAVDDLADRALPVDVVVNGGAGAEGLPYERRLGTVLLLGPTYALLHSSFATAPNRTDVDRVRRVLVCVGGGRQGEVALTALAAVDRVLDACVIDLVVGPFGIGAGDLDAVARGARNRIIVHRDRVELRDLMLSADIAVSAAGVTLLELAATSTPTVAITLADNQQPNFKTLTQAGMALGAGAGGDPDLASAIEACVGRLASDRALRAIMATRGRSLVDGQGAQRVARLIGHATASRTR